MFSPDDRDFCGRNAAASLIKKLHAGGGSDLTKLGGGRLRKPDRAEKLSITLERTLKKAGIGIKPEVNLERIDDTFNAAGIRRDSVEVLAKILSRAASRGLALPPSTFSDNLKKGLPPESNNAQNDDERADDGAELAHDAQEAERQRAGVRQQVSPFGGPHSAPHASSVRGMQALRTQNDGNPNDPTIEAVKTAQRNPIPLVPGSLGGSAKNPNRDDAVR